MGVKARFQVSLHRLAAVDDMACLNDEGECASALNGPRCRGRRFGALAGWTRCPSP